MGNGEHVIHNNEGEITNTARKTRLKETVSVSSLSLFYIT